MSSQHFARLLPLSVTIYSPVINSVHNAVPLDSKHHRPSPNRIP